jgi:hypothetical protein
VGNATDFQFLGADDQASIDKKLCKGQRHDHATTRPPHAVALPGQYEITEAFADPVTDEAAIRKIIAEQVTATKSTV